MSVCDKSLLNFHYIFITVRYSDVRIPFIIPLIIFKIIISWHPYTHETDDPRQFKILVNDSKNIH